MNYLLASLVIGIVGLGIGGIMNEPTHDWDKMEGSIQNYLDDFTRPVPGEHKPDAKTIIEIIKRHKIGSND